MRIASLNVNRPVADDAAVDDTRASGPSKRLPAPRAESKAETQAPLRRGLAQWNPQLNEQLTKGQQALAFLDEVESRLQGLKADLSAKLAAEQAGDARLDGKLRDFAELWRQRRAASGNSLDGRLGYSAENPARQRFRIKGLDGNALQAGGKETLAFSVGGAGQRLLVVAVDPALPEAAQARRFEQALAPAGIRVARDDQGGLEFSVPESAWPAVRDTLAVKGGGIRLPGGQLTRVKTEAEPEAIRPGEWKSGDVDALRRTLKDVLDALGRVRNARETLQRALAEARSRLGQAASPDDRDWAFAFAADFEALAFQPAYEVYSAVAPALTSISSDRVQSLLALD